MKVFVYSPLQLPYVMVEAPLPSGAEIVKNSSEEGNIDQSQAKPSDSSVTTDTDNSGAGLSGDWEYAWWTHEDVLDDKVAFFGTNLPQGKSTFHKLIRMELPGTFGVNPVRLEGMYTDKVRGYSALSELTVTEEDAK